MSALQCLQRGVGEKRLEPALARFLVLCVVKFKQQFTWYETNMY